MPVNITVPASTPVRIQAFTDAAYLQQVTITPPAGGNPIVWTGSGENETPIGTVLVTTPSSPSGTVVYGVNVQYSADGGRSWQPSSLLPGGTVIASFNLQVVLSEDHVDQDYNDAVVQFIWWQPLSGAGNRA